MLLVNILVNTTPILSGHAVRIKGDENPDSVNTYRLHDGTNVRHRYGDGAAKLAQKIIKRISEWETSIDGPHPSKSRSSGKKKGR